MKIPGDFILNCGLMRLERQMMAQSADVVHLTNVKEFAMGFTLVKLLSHHATL